MKEYKNIDRVFQENFKDMEIYPSKNVWNNIENHLQGNQRKRVLPLWQKLSGIAVAFLLLFSLGFNYFKTGKKLQFNINNFSIPDFNNSVADRDTNSIMVPVFKNQRTISEKNAIVDTNTKNILQKNTDTADQFLITEDNYTDIVVYEEKQTDATEFRENLNVDLFKESINKKYDNQIAGVTQDEIKEKKWSVGPTISPVYMNTLQKGSPISKDLQNNSTVSDEALSYGIKLDYKLTNKFRIQTGINKVELAYNTKNVNAVVSSSKSINHNIDTKYNGVHLSSASREVLTESASSNLNKSNVNGDLNQSFDYLEIPMEMKYNIYESKIGLNIVGGFSTFILTNNQVSMVLTDQIYSLGKANNLNAINFSGNLGFDLDYKISKDWYFNVSPMFKYQFNTFSENAGNFKPYYFGVYSGINYRF
jgi:hypothetical protein